MRYADGCLILKNSVVLLFIATLMGCGFQLRGDLTIPAALRILSICPDQPLEPFQRVLRRILCTNQVQILGNQCPGDRNTLVLLKQNFSERGLAYGTDVQINRILLQFTVEYQITDPRGKVIFDCHTLQVERELTVNPNAVLGTEHDRQRVQQELYNDAAMQLLRQLSFASLEPK